MTSQLRRQLIDDLMDAYVDWREECVTLAEAYERWSSAWAEERRLAFGAYRAALDREQQASTVYVNRFDTVARRVTSRRRRAEWLGLSR